MRGKEVLSELSDRFTCFLSTYAFSELLINDAAGSSSLYSHDSISFFKIEVDSLPFIDCHCIFYFKSLD